MQKMAQNRTYQKIIHQQIQRLSHRNFHMKISSRNCNLRILWRDTAFKLFLLRICWEQRMLIRPNKKIWEWHTRLERFKGLVLSIKGSLLKSFESHLHFQNLSHCLPIYLIYLFNNIFVFDCLFFNVVILNKLPSCYP